MPGSPRLIYEFGPYLLDPSERRLLLDGKEVSPPLRKLVFDLLRVLVQNHGSLMTNDQLLREVWEIEESSDARVAVTIGELRKKLGDEEFIENVPGSGYRFIAPVKELRREQGATTASANRDLNFSDPPTPGGAVPLESQFYIARETDDKFFAAMARRDSVVLVKGPPQVGKTSLLARGAQRARESGSLVVLTYLRSINIRTLSDSDQLLLSLAEQIADTLQLESLPHKIWNSFLGPSANFQRYLQRHILEKAQQPLVWVIDDVDELFSCDNKTEIFALFRWLHNLRAYEPEGPWMRLTLALAYATEAHLFITDPNQSPFNVGTQVTLEDFSLDQVADLNQRYGRLLTSQNEISRYNELTGGHPYLAQRGFYEMYRNKMDLAAIETKADHEDGIFGSHLRSMWFALERDRDLCDAVRSLLHGQKDPPPLTTGMFYRLRSAGILTGDSPADARPRSGLYARYLKKRLL
ncbi:MAG: AAA-like domain-containing protein [Acidobacteria bacterium]|nr:AAA-like domain-containing protein [Acidobacteriota bacterium]